MTDEQQQQTATIVELTPPVSERVQWKRDTKAIVVEIDCAVMAQAIPGGHVVQQGVHRYLIAKSDLRIVKLMERTDEQRRLYALATESFNREFQHLCDDDPVVQEARKKGDSKQVEQRIKELTAWYGGSPEACMQRDYRCELASFERVTVVEDDLTNPVDALRFAEQQELIERERAGRTEETAGVAAIVAAEVAKALAPFTAALAAVLPPTKKGG